MNTKIATTTGTCGVKQQARKPRETITPQHTNGINKGNNLDRVRDDGAVDVAAVSA